MLFENAIQYLLRLINITSILYFTRSLKVYLNSRKKTWGTCKVYSTGIQRTCALIQNTVNFGRKLCYNIHYPHRIAFLPVFVCLFGIRMYVALINPTKLLFSCSLGNLANADSFSKLTKKREKKKKSNFHLSSSEVRSAEKKSSSLCWWIFYKLYHLIKDVFKNGEHSA